MHAIEVNGLGKRLRLGEDPQAYARLTETLQRGAVRLAQRLRGEGATPASPDEFWALRDVSFTADGGEVLALIGHNGAGKTTLLRILSRISPPTEGVVRLRGRVGSLLDVGTGFHPELTGRENVYLYGAVLGMERSEVRRRFDDIVAFAEVERFIDTPLKRYSSGMYLRLGFAVAAHLEPEILFVDEILAVGDLAFQQRCVARMTEIARGGATVIFVSHNLSLVSATCTRAVLLERGRLIDDGPVFSVLDRYTASVQRMAVSSLEERLDRQGSGVFRFVGIEVAGARGPAMTGNDLEVRIAFAALVPPPEVNVTVSIYGLLGEPLVGLSNRLSGQTLGPLPPAGELHCTVPGLPLGPGRYSIGLTAETADGLADKVSNAHFFDIVIGDFFGERQNLLDRSPLLYLEHSWAVVERGSSKGRRSAIA